MAALSRRPLPLCRFERHTCAACCWGEAVPRHRLHAALRRQTRLFPRTLNRFRLLRHELASRRGLDLLLGLLLRVPLVSEMLRPWLRPRIVCAFLGYEDAAEQRVGCLLHPSHWSGREVRPRAAFALLRGFSCGSPDWYCLAAHWFARATWEERRTFARAAAGLDWFRFSQVAAGYGMSSPLPTRPDENAGSAAHSAPDARR
jgi:hypothetical protein